MQLGFSFNVTSDTVALTNFVKLLTSVIDCTPHGLVAKPLSDLYCDSSSNFQSND